MRLITNYLKIKDVYKYQMQSKLEALKLKREAVKANDQSWVPVDIPYKIKDQCKATKKIRFDKGQWMVRKCDEHLFAKLYQEDTKGLTYEEKKLFWEIDATYDKERDEFFFLKFQMDE
jgi:hypothetical protein